MKKLIFITLAFALCIGGALANDVGKLMPASSTTVTVDMLHATVSSCEFVVFQSAPSVLQDTNKFLLLNKEMDSWRNPEYGRKNNRLNQNYNSPGIKLYKEKIACNYNVNNSYGLRY